MTLSYDIASLVGGALAFDTVLEDLGTVFGTAKLAMTLFALTTSRYLAIVVLSDQIRFFRNQILATGTGNTLLGGLLELSSTKISKELMNGSATNTELYIP